MRQKLYYQKIFIDCTASETIVDYYPQILKNGIHIVTPNKKALSCSFQKYKKIKQSALSGKAKFLYETTVGAGLPVINTLRSLYDTGDQIFRIEGVLSGTLSYIFNHYDGQKQFSKIVKEAHQKSYTEPDPRDDLNGKDVARKLLILARELGKNWELTDIKIENLTTLNCRNAPSVNDFFKELLKTDKQWEKRRKKTADQGCVLRYIACIDNKKGRVELKSVSQNHPFYHLSDRDNIISFTTNYYHPQPLVIKGPGAGTEVTAAGILADVLKII